MNRSRRGGLLRGGVLCLLVTALLGACGDDDDDGDDESSSATTTTAPVAVDGCGEEAATDLTVRSADRPIARCEAGAPAARPLDDQTTLNVGTIARGEFAAPLFLGDALGEFEAENLDVDIQVLPFPDQVSQLASGNLDVIIGDFGVAWYNAVEQGIEAKAVMASFFTGTAGDLDVEQQGLWVRRDVFSDPDDPDAAELNGARLASNDPAGSASVVLALQSLADEGLDPGSLQIQPTPSPEQVQALQNGAVDAALLIDPFWTQVRDDPDMVMLATLPAGEPLSGYMFGTRLLREEPEVGDAFVRAMVRTINTYLTTSFHEDDPETVAALATALEVEPEQLTAFPTPVFDWEIREGSTDALQDAFRSFGTLQSPENLPEDDLVDRGFVARAVGADAGS